MGDGANAEQRAEWNGPAATGWVANDAAIDAWVRPIGERAMEVLSLEAGATVLDVGCGSGATTVELARRVGPSGRVVGIDVSRPLLDVARSRVREADLANVELEELDAQVAQLPSCDAVFSRMGVMFFEDPAAAFANLASALEPSGRLAFAAWQAPDRNPWVVVPLLTAAAHLPMPSPPGPGSPGPFSLADPDRVRTLLEGAGLSGIDVEAVTLEAPLPGRDVEMFADLILEVVPTLASGMAAADGATRSTVRSAVVDALRPHESDGAVVLPAAAWVVSATKG